MSTKESHHSVTFSLVPQTLRVTPGKVDPLTIVCPTCVL